MARFRLWRPRDAAVTFMENRTSIGDALQHDGGSGGWVHRSGEQSDEAKRVDKIWKEADLELEKLFEALENLHAKHNKSADKISIRAMNWDEVFEQISRAADQYDSEATGGSKAGLKRFFRKVVESAPAMKQWMNLIPSGDYGTCIAGAFQMFATAAQRSFDIRTSVREIMEEIPYILRRNLEIVSIYQGTPRDALTKAVAGLVKAIVVTLQRVIEYLTNNSFKRGWDAMWQGEGFHVSLEDSIKEIRWCEEFAQKEANLKLHRTVKGWVAFINDEPGVEKLAKSLYSLLRNEMQQQGLPSQVSTLETQQPMEERDAYAYAENDSKVLCPKIQREAISRRSLLRLLGFDSTSSAREIKECQNMQYVLGADSSNIGNYVIQSEAFNRWITKGRKSSSFFVDANQRDAAANDISATSVLSAELVSLFSLASSAIVVSHFCGLNADVEIGEENWVPNMLKEMISQLLAQPKDRELKFDLSFLTSGHLEAIKESDLDSLCKIFQKLVLQLPTGKVFFCILDSVSRFEVHSLAETQSIQVMEMLTKLVRGKKDVVMKLLLTSPFDSFHIGYKEMGRSVIVDYIEIVPESVDTVVPIDWDMEIMEEVVGDLV